MDTYYDWHLIRGLLFLLVFGLFVIYAVLTGMAQARKAKRDVRRMTEQDAPPSVQRQISHSGDGRPARPARPQQSRREDSAVAGSARQAA